MNVSNAAVYYQLAVPGGSGFAGDIVWESLEHLLVPSLSSFSDPAKEGFLGARSFAAVRIRSALAGTPALVTVI